MKRKSRIAEQMEISESRFESMPVWVQKSALDYLERFRDRQRLQAKARSYDDRRFDAVRRDRHPNS